MFGRTKEKKEDTAENNADGTVSDKAVYELGYHLLPAVAEGELENKVSSIKNLFLSEGGKEIESGFPKMIELAYTISLNEEGKNTKYNTAYFGWVKFDLPADKILPLKEKLSEDKNILRHILFKTVKESTLAPKRILLEKIAPAHKELAKSPIVKKQARTPESEAEIEKAVEELVGDSKE